MDTRTPPTPPDRARPLARTPAETEKQTPSPDWRADNGIVDRMSAYSEWWNLPAGKSRPARKAARIPRGPRPSAA